MTSDEHIDEIKADAEKALRMLFAMQKRHQAHEMKGDGLWSEFDGDPGLAENVYESIRRASMPLYRLLKEDY